MGALSSIERRPECGESVIEGYLSYYIVRRRKKKEKKKKKKQNVNTILRVHDTDS